MACSQAYGSGSGERLNGDNQAAKRISPAEPPIWLPLATQMPPKPADARTVWSIYIIIKGL